MPGGLRGGAESAVAGAGAGEAASFGAWAVLLPIAIVVVVALALAGSGNPKTVKVPTKGLEAEPLNVVQATAEPDYPSKAAFASAEPDARGAPVGVRNTARTALFAADDADLKGIEKPFANSEAGFSYNDFQRAMAHGREMPEVDRAPPSNAPHVKSHIASMKAFIKRNGMTVNEFSEARDAFLPESMLDSWNYEEPTKPQRVVADASEDALMYAREALQDIPTNVSHDAIVPVLREILAARTEAASAGIQLPSVTDEQRASLKSWSTRGSTAGSLAGSILSRS